MPNIIIVDDESIYRRGLRKLIGELDPEWQIVGEATDGYEALRLIEELKPDAMLTDIRMPSMDGIQLQQLSREQFPDMECIVISGYGDFAYIQQSMRQGARDYMMKPIERDELAKVLTAMKRRLQERSVMRALRTREQYEISQHASEHLIKELMRGSAAGAGDIRLLETMGIAFSLPAFVCMVIKLDKSSVDNDRYKQANPTLFQLYIKQVVQEVTTRNGVGVAVIMSETEVAALLNVPEREDAAKDVHELAGSVRRALSSLSRITVTIGVGRPKRGYAGIVQSYAEAEIALLYRLIHGGDRVLFYQESGQGTGGATEAAEQEVWQALELAVNEGKREDIQASSDRYIELLCRSAGTPEAVHQSMCKLFIHYYDWAGKSGVASDWLGTQDMKGLLLHICSISSREELKETCSGLLLSLSDCLAARSAKAAPDPVRRAEQYMERHFAKPLSLGEVADHVYLNAAYFSSLFKQKTGKTFVERLTEIRIAEAKRLLLHTDHKLSVISEATGFPSIRHFNRVFRAATGESPNVYKGLHRRG